MKYFIPVLVTWAMLNMAGVLLKAAHAGSLDEWTDQMVRDRQTRETQYQQQQQRNDEYVRDQQQWQDKQRADERMRQLESERQFNDGSR